MNTITVDRAVLEQALEALESLFNWQVDPDRGKRCSDAITALRKLLAQQEQEPVAWMLTDDSGMRFVSVDRPHPDFVPLYTAPPRREPEQEQAEPVLVVEKEPDYMSRGHFYEGSKPFIDPTLVWKLPIGTKLYTTPPRREWQRLTNEEMYGLYRRAGLEVYYPRDGVVQGDYDMRIDAYARAIEAKLKEKNNG